MTELASKTGVVEGLISKTNKKVCLGKSKILIEIERSFLSLLMSERTKGRKQESTILFGI